MAGVFPNRTDTDVTPEDPVGAEILGWTKDHELYLDQSTLIRPSVEGILDKANPQIVSGQKSFSDFEDALVAEQERAASH
jgi:hypothetical protein